MVSLLFKFLGLIIIVCFVALQFIELLRSSILLRSSVIVQVAMSLERNLQCPVGLGEESSVHPPPRLLVDETRGGEDEKKTRR